MADTTYRFGTHADVPDVVPQLTRLQNTAFCEYEGAMPISEAFTEWYLRRPGSLPELCPVALDGDRLASNVLVCIQDLQLGGEVLRCGIIDTVATDPAHRRKGLARRLMEDAHRLIRDAGADAAVLYTNPDGHPYQFYQGMGYQTRAFGAALVGLRPRGISLQVEPARDSDAGAIQALLDRFHAEYDGYCPMNPDMWRWHRAHRPQDMPVELKVIRDGHGAVVATACFAPVEILVAGETVPGSIISDFAAAVDEMTCLDALMAAAPQERVMAFIDVETPMHGWLIRRGSEAAVRESAMALPFSEAGRRALEHAPRLWYVMIESVVGV